MHDMNESSQENRLRDRIGSGSQNAEDYLALARMLYSIDRFEDSVAVLRLGLRLPLSDLSRGTLLILMGWNLISATDDLEEALSLAEQAAALSRGLKGSRATITRAKAQTLIAYCVWKTDSTRAADAAISALSEFAQITDSCEILDSETLYEIHFEAAKLNCALGRTEEAEKRCEQALRLAHGRTEAHRCVVELGTIFFTAGRLTEARESFAKAANSLGATPYARVRPYYELGLTERALGKLPEARAKLRKALEILQEDTSLSRVFVPDILHSITEISYELGDLDGARTASLALVDLYPETNPRYWLSLQWLAKCQWDLGQLEIARTNLEQIAESSLAPEDQREHAKAVLPRLRLSIAESHYDSKDYASCIAESESLLPQLVQCDESYLALLLLLGHSYLVTGKNPSAQRCYIAILACPFLSPTYRAIAERSLATLPPIHQ
jgi:tetratricopeptide (TPR) repeat protein